MATAILSRPGRWAAAFACLSTIALTVPAPAQPAPERPPLIQPNDVDALAAILEGYGSAEVERTDGGDPVILGTLNGTGYQVFYLDCREGRDCRSASFYAIWNTPGVSLEQVNDWNRSDPFHKAYLTEENFPVLELNVSLVGGLTARNVDDIAERWTVALAKFETTVLNPGQ
ncbi:YbjN domain-containing protein [Aurantimonas sp. Leaf443]|uniref:YbjN domain-containing protein n=1 Tax=Aurantimonas sp. Leaf443 TaxID=1736378 RepID=UPI0006F27AA6|nr:YbjN domain-containing protein [Aurantimonas sp. Leaf443]KQT86053.1 hypothetical protein ASG48_05575 [Aurantimonas sp. Leaf443]